jgi:hypothetical protein
LKSESSQIKIENRRLNDNVFDLMVDIEELLFLLFKNLILYLPVTEATNKLARSFMVDFTDYMRPVDIIWGYVYL